MNKQIQEFATQAGLQPFEDSGPGYVAKMTKFGELAWSDGFQAGLAQAVQAQMSNPVYKQAMDEYYQRIWAHRLISQYIELNKEYWGPEFAYLIKVPHRPEHDEIAAMGAHTMLYKIADEFCDGKFRAEILKQFGVE